MSEYFPHEKLRVYQLALRFVHFAADIRENWPPSIPVRKHFEEACESVIMNLAQSVKESGSQQGVYSIECSLGSVLECSASLDIGDIRELVPPSQMRKMKKHLQDVARMEVGLRKRWENRISEDEPPYQTGGPIYFSHEKLRVYQEALSIYDSLHDKVFQNENGRVRRIRRIDKAATSLILNIAEGNGRFSHRDHSQFLDHAEDSGTKLAVYLDVLELDDHEEFSNERQTLRGVMAMINGLKESLTEE